MAKHKFQQSKSAAAAQAPATSKPTATVVVAAPVVNVAPPTGAPKTVEEVAGFTAAQLIVVYGNKSNAIRGMAALGMKPGPISKTLGIIYQHARNVLKRPLKKAVAEVQATTATPGTTAEGANKAAA